MAADPERDLAGEELAAKIREIRDRVRAGHPAGHAAGGIELPDLVPLLQARDSAQGKVASIGSVNPRRPGLVNGAIQTLKRTVARLLAWHVREQVEFNRASLAAIDASLEALNQNNRALSQLADVFSRWTEWRTGFERRLAATENQLLRTIAELKTGFDFRLGQTSEEIQQRLWADLAALRRDFENVRGEYERLIHTELRLIRQREVQPPPSAPPAAGPVASAPQLDYARLAERFRGSEDYVRQKLRFYLPFFAGLGDVLDLGCGRGEFLELLREAAVPARGIELSAELAALGRGKGLEVECGDLLAYLPTIPDESLGGIFCAHVVEHLPAESLAGLIRVAARKLRPDGIVAIETPNPESLASISTQFYLDPTHVRPVPAGLLSFYLEEAGMGRIQIHRLSPAVENAPSLASVPTEFRDAFFGALDYAIIAWKL